MRRNSRFLVPLLVAAAALFSIGVASRHSLQRGQTIKQFFAYSIAQSLAVDSLNPLKTELPCLPARTWVEEPPIFHSIGAAFIRLMPAFPFLFPFLCYCLTLGCVYLLARGYADWALITAACGTSPILLRYSIQFIPDDFALSLLCAGVVLTIKKYRKAAIFTFCLATTTKALVIFPIALILLADEFHAGGLSSSQRSRRLAIVLAQLGLCILPFLIWLGIIFHLQIPNPFMMNSWVNNRHSGPLGLLLSGRYWIRFVTWVAIKGAGVVLFGAASVFVFQSVRRFTRKPAAGRLPDRLTVILIFWAMGVLPYWCLVRVGNFVHDHYTLPFVVPISFLGALLLSRQKPALRYALFLLNVGLGLANLLEMKPVEPDPRLGRPSYCDMEIWDSPHDQTSGNPLIKTSTSRRNEAVKLEI